MRHVSFRSLVVVASLALLPLSAFAQEAVISGTITDATGGVLPGVVIHAVNQASGNSFEAVTGQKRLDFGRRVKAEGLVEVFNVFNHANYGSYVTQENNAQYGQPTQNPGITYAPRTAQLGFRLMF